MLELLKAVLFGIVEGVTEWLPISSTGHMILLDKFIHLGVSAEFYKLFEVVIQLGAILAVIILYFEKIWPLKNKNGSLTLDRATLNLWGKIIVACFPAAIIGILFDDWMEDNFFTPQVVSLALIAYGFLFVIIEKYDLGSKSVQRVEDISYRKAFEVGVFQLFSLVPGTSRSGSTIIGGLLIGLERSVAAEFTFYLAIPVMIGASLLKLIKYIMRVGFVFDSNELLILAVGCIVAFIVSIIVIRFLMSYIKKHNFIPFGYYRIVLGILVLVYFKFLN
ncbi:MAG: undecaprenyl-diphosphate phosphatase [Acidaminococcaceae bacterium]|nr:undecaprenyl-diphosphate phosphatase [Acidaminococcaceae bacterium]MBQ9257116.1 undecaprenyl-diphosphate phosphatase [Acidaminococcaceae bacterium]